MAHPHRLPWHDEFEGAIMRQLQQDLAPTITRPYCPGCTKSFSKFHRAITVPRCPHSHQICILCAQDWFCTHDECPTCGFGTLPLFELRNRAVAPTFGREDPCTQILDREAYVQEPPFHDHELARIHPHSMLQICFTDGEVTRRGRKNHQRANDRRAAGQRVPPELVEEIQEYDFHAMQYFRLRDNRGEPDWSRWDERQYQESCKFLREIIIQPGTINFRGPPPPGFPDMRRLPGSTATTGGVNQPSAPAAVAPDMMLPSPDTSDTEF
ncbi:hypothetical protein CB0940_00205 [Cercospora beticola]|nr:hypothetical protein CB0940_00205 [Cercospora beticola]PIB01794.1 hypothetical protein CB0940_00205 [Cercospora beticola]